MLLFYIPAGPSCQLRSRPVTKFHEGNMQAKWSFPSWLFQYLPSPFLISSSDSCIDNRTKNHLQFDFQNSQLFKLARLFTITSTVKPSSNKYAGDAWAAALRCAILVFPLLDNTSQIHGRSKTWEKRKFSIASNLDACGSINMAIVMAYTHALATVFERILLASNQLCVPTVLALSGALMSPLENLPKLLPSQVDKDEVQDKDIFRAKDIANGDVISPQFCTNSRMLEDLQKDIVEPRTGFKFPSILCSDSDQSQTCANMQVLAGIGLKKVTVVKVKSLNIYAFGFYIMPEVLKTRLVQKYGNVPPEELKHNSCFYEDLLRYSSEMTVRLIVQYKGLKMGMVRSAFDTSLRNRLKKIKGAETDDGLSIFNSYFSEDLSLPQGTTIDFKQLAGGIFRTEINGKLIGNIHSRDFCRAFFDIYVGDPPVSQKTKEEIGERLGEIMRMS